MIRNVLNRVLLFIVAFSLIASWEAAAAEAQQVWEKIAFERWGKKEINQVLTDSPWAKVFEANINLTRRAAENELSHQFSAAVLLRSAVPVRQALYRQRQLDSAYERMNADEKLAFEKKNKPLLECPSCKDFYSISLISIHQDVYPRHFSEELRKKIYLMNEKGDRRFLAAMVEASASEVVFLFPRLDENQRPLLTPDSRKLTFQMDIGQRYPDTPAFLRKVEFDVTKIVRNGTIEY